MIEKTSCCLISEKRISQFVNKPVYIDDVPAGIIESVEHDEECVSATIKLNGVGAEKLKEMFEVQNETSNL